MERPSHIHINGSHSFSRRFASLALALFFPLAVLWGLLHGLAASHVFNPGELQLTPVKQERKIDIPPPPTKMEEPQPIRADKPVFHMDEPPNDPGSVTATTRPDIPPATGSTSIGADRAAAGILSTHTIPPYPMLEQRLGIEGKVTLRLTVLADGSVGKAEVITSSGRSGLDDAARQWILTHWSYRPALEKGQPVASQTLATVVFSLRNAR